MYGISYKDKTVVRPPYLYRIRRYRYTEAAPRLKWLVNKAQSIRSVCRLLQYTIYILPPPPTPREINPNLNLAKYRLSVTCFSVVK